EEAGALHAAGIGRNHGQLRQVHAFDVIDQHRRGKQVIDGNIEKALDLHGVQIDHQGAVGAGGGKQVGDQLGADGSARAVFAVLAGIAEIGDHRSDAARRSALERVDHQQQLNDVAVDGRTSGLHHEDIGAAHVFLDL